MVVSLFLTVHAVTAVMLAACNLCTSTCCTTCIWIVFYDPKIWGSPATSECHLCWWFSWFCFCFFCGQLCHVVATFQTRMDSERDPRIVHTLQCVTGDQLKCQLLQEQTSMVSDTCIIEKKTYFYILFCSSQVICILPVSVISFLCFGTSTVTCKRCSD